MMETSWDIVAAKAIKQFQDNVPFVLYAKPGQERATALFQDDAVSYATTDFEEQGFVFVSFSNEDKDDRFLIPEPKSGRFAFRIPDAVLPMKTPEANYGENDKLDFERLVSKGIAAIESGKFGKVVLSRKETVALSGFDFIDAYSQLLAAYPATFRYCWFHPRTGLWMGATPERLLKIENNKFETVALAGTQAFQGTEKVVWQEKEKAEQQFVTDFITEGLRNSASGIALSGPYTARAGNLLHIKTDISGRLDEASGLKAVLGILHPTPAVCGYPKAESKKFILENEGYDREFYSGFLGETNFGKSTDLFVNLRSMKIDGNRANLYVGCGITRDSDPGKEFAETVNKSLTMKKILCNWIS